MSEIMALSLLVLLCAMIFFDIIGPVFVGLLQVVFFPYMFYRNFRKSRLAQQCLGHVVKLEIESNTRCTYPMRVLILGTSGTFSPYGEKKRVRIINIEGKKGKVNDYKICDVWKMKDLGLIDEGELSSLLTCNDDVVREEAAKLQKALKETSNMEKGK